MNWKIFMMLCVSTFIVSFPQNIIGCGPGIDPYDYYTSFFNPDISETSNLRPFYYTNYNVLYEDAEPVNNSDILAEEWKSYCGNGVSQSDAKAFVMNYPLKEISAIYATAENNTRIKISDSVRRNSMTKYFLAQKDMEGLGYVMYAKKAEPFVTGEYDSWEPLKRDSIRMATLIANGKQLYNATQKDFFKLKYAYQLIRLAFYSGNNADAIKFCNEYVPLNKTSSVLQPLALALKAGALYRTGAIKQAAYLYSKAFSTTDAKKISNYQSFRWATGKSERNEFLQLCKSNEEKANMLALFALGSPVEETAVIKEISTLDPANKFLSTLVAREINKLEEKYFTPALNNQHGGKLFYYTWQEKVEDSSMMAAKKEVVNLADVLIQLSDANKKQEALFKIAAAYCALMVKDFTKADGYLAAAKKGQQTAKINDQWMLTNLLLTINESKEIDAAAEEKILPSVKWLQQKATDEKEVKIGDDNVSSWKIFYRNIMAEALAKKYHAQGDIYKEAFAVGAADKIFNGGNYNALDFLHNKTDIKDVEKMYALLTAKNLSSFENYLVKNNAVSVAAVTDFAGTAYLRNYDYKMAIDWLKRSGASETDTIFKSAFIELLDDREERLPKETRKTSKLSFAKEMLLTQNLAETYKANAATNYYKLATGMYNMTYYGHAWELVQYYRSGSDGYFIPANATSFQKEYYGCYAAHDMFKKAMMASNNQNFKAKCLFMMAKCIQKTVGRPQYENFPDYSDFAKAEKAYYPTFKKNKYFPQFVKEYSATAFYKEAYSRCSYLRDFVKKK